MYQRVQQAPIDVKELKPALPDYVAHVIMHCLEKDAANRYQSAKEILADSTPVAARRSLPPSALAYDADPYPDC